MLAFPTSLFKLCSFLAKMTLPVNGVIPSCVQFEVVGDAELRDMAFEQ